MATCYCIALTQAGCAIAAHVAMSHDSQRLAIAMTQADVMEILYRAAKQDTLKDGGIAFQGQPTVKAIFESLISKSVQVLFLPMNATASAICVPTCIICCEVWVRHQGLHVVAAPVLAVYKAHQTFC